MLACRFLRLRVCLRESGEMPDKVRMFQVDAALLNAGRDAAVMSVMMVVVVTVVVEVVVRL